MIGQWIDSAISVFSPAWAAKRAMARRVYQAQSKRAYEAARQDRTTSAWLANSQSADRSLYGEAERVRNRVRDLVRNNSYARGALDAIVANVIGCGISPKPAIADDQERSDRILDKWNDWCERADVTGRLHFYEMQALVLREMVESGEVILNKVMQPTDAMGVPFAIEMIESERIASDTEVWAYRRNRATPGNQIRRGVEVDKTGRAVAYYLYRDHPNDLAGEVAEAERVPAENLLHIYRQERIGQTRGISWLAPAVLRLRDLDMYLENELQASAVAACFSVVVKTVDSGASWGGLNTPDGGEATDSNSDRFERLQPGMVSHIMPNEEIEVVNPMRPNAAADAFLATMLRSISVATGLSYELVSRDYSRTNYSSNRASALEDQRRFRPLQKMLIWRLCQPVYRAWFSQCCLASDAGIAGYEAFPSFTEYLADPGYWTKCTWRPPGWAWVDPLKEVNAAVVAINNQLRSRQDVIEEGNGGDIREVFRELSQEQALAEEMEIELGDPAINAAKEAQASKEESNAEEGQATSTA
jgi:lambda family phage portal protein